VTPSLILGGDIQTGCAVNNSDKAYTGAANPYQAGSFKWSIPTQYVDDTLTRHTFGDNQVHISTYNAAGTATQSKGGQSDSATLNAASSGW